MSGRFDGSPKDSDSARGLRPRQHPRTQIKEGVLGRPGRLAELTKSEGLQHLSGEWFPEKG